MAMLRLFSARCCSTILDHGHSLVSRVAKKRTIKVIPVNSASFNPQRHVSTGRAVWKDALPTSKPEGPETLDLDGWKSVMRSQAAPKEKQVTNESVESDGENLEEPEGEPKDCSLEAMRELVEMWRLAGKLVPQELTAEELEEFAKITTKSARKKYLKHLALRERHKLTRKKKQLEKAAVRETMMKERSDEEDGQSEDKWKNNLFLTFWSRSLNNCLGWRSASAMMFGQPLVFDMSYASEMSKQEMDNTVSQLMEVEGWNRRASEPYHLHFCNLQHNGPYMQELLKRYGEETWNRLLITTTHRQHVEVFPREQLVYLTADSPNVLRKYDNNKVYIIGAMVDRSIHSGLSLANAKRLKLNTARLPLEQYLHWEMGGKNLTLDQMIRIMLTLKETGKWEEALQFVPKRKHDGFHQEKRHSNITNRGTPIPEWRDQGKTVINAKQNVYRKNTGFSASEKMTGFTRGENTSPRTKIRTSLKSNLEARKSAGRKEWWNDK